MGSRFSFILLPALALCTLLIGESTLARQGEAEDSLSGVVIETLGRGTVEEESGEELVLLRVTIEPGASIPASHGLRAGLLVLEECRVGVQLERAAVEAGLTLVGGNGSVSAISGHRNDPCAWRCDLHR